MKNLTDLAAGIVGVVALLFAVYQFYLFATFKNAQGMFDLQGGQSHLWMAIAATVVAFVGGLIVFVRHVNKEEEIHITQ